MRAAQSPPASQRLAHVVLPDVPRTATIDKSGRRVRVPVEHRWRAICFSEPGGLSHARLMALAIDATYSHSVQDAPRQVGDDPRGEGEKDHALDIDFVVSGDIPAAAHIALARAEDYLERQFSDPIRIVIRLEFVDDLPGNVLGATGMPFVRLSWRKSREALFDGRDESDRIQKFLPPGNTIPVRYNGRTQHTVQENRVFWTLANFRAAVGSINGDAGHIILNSNLQWDYDPDDGVAGHSLIDVLVHEVGHVLGFGSGVDFRERDIEALDIFRFQRTDGPADNNPDTYIEFRDRPRLASFNAPNNDAISDLIIAQYRMSDGSPFQASHFRNQPLRIGIMDPQLSAGETFAPQFLRAADKRMFDALGWDR